MAKKSGARRERAASKFVPVEDPEKITEASAVPAGANKGSDVEKYRSMYVRQEVERDKGK